MRPYFCKFTLPVENNLFYRVRTHGKGTGKYFFTNISELSYRSDLFNITKFGRCNCPYESIFYCSDSALLALIEVTQLYKIETKKDALYHTLSIWKITQPLNITPIFQSEDAQNQNKRLVSITNECLKTIDSFNNYNKKEELKEFHNLIGKEFIKPFSDDANIYFFSSAVASYSLNEKVKQNERIDGLTYPTCIDSKEIKNFGLNYAFDPTIIGFESKIQFVGAYRSKMERRHNSYYETERIKFKNANRITGEIRW